MAGLFPSIILRQCFARIGAYQGQAAAVEASYLLTDPATNAKSASFTKSVLLDGLVTVEQEIAIAVASNREHPWRAVLHDTTDALASGVTIPKVGLGTATAKIIGEYGEVKDSASPFRALTADLTVAEIRALNQNIGTMFSMDYFSYAYELPRILHTRPAGAKIDVCVYDYDVRKIAIFAYEELLFTEAEGAYFSGLMSLLMNTDALLTELSKMYAPRYAEWLKSFRAGQAEL